jgi:hypothetical protein
MIEWLEIIGSELPLSATDLREIPVGLVSVAAFLRAYIMLTVLPVGYRRLQSACTLRPCGRLLWN